jgi:hypothetical protein
MNERQHEKWTAEFEKLGAAGVKNGMMVGRWDKDKRSAARQWLERRDVADFQSTRPSGSPPKTFFMKGRSKWWWIYFAGALLLAMGAARVFSKF